MTAKVLRHKVTGVIYLRTRSGQLIEYGIGQDAEDRARKAAKQANARHDRHRLMLDLGMQRVQGALGGIYYE